MSLSEFLQQENIFRTALSGSSEKLKNDILKAGEKWFKDNPAESEIIKENLLSFGFQSNSELLRSIEKNITLHYYEKFLGLCLKPVEFKSYLRNHILGEDSIAKLQNSLKSNRAVFLASGHFGAVEFIIPYLASFNLPVSAVLRFKTERLSETVHNQAQAMTKGGEFGKIGLIEIGKPGSPAALEMASVLRKKEILLSMFDEKTEYSKPVSLLNKEVWGGAGIDRILRFSGSDIDLYSAFMVREGDEQYRLTLNKADLEDPLNSLFGSLEQLVTKHPHQWYFLHEEIPFVK
ncbi:hypothetical protein QA601_13235 [Chitinispirillales bacterium ANBcel5]|uniref:hypothetical protein n=1 Tax=Cellulosispirillum alkaliphilum TaxID=3039283 RepID=UPI002A58536F|nr:hypothetical protein [Chitinispirillales bacterium ANBcel5]